MLLETKNKCAGVEWVLERVVGVAGPAQVL